MTCEVNCRRFDACKIKEDYCEAAPEICESFSDKNKLFPPIMIGDTIYSCGHGNRKTPEEFKVYYLGWNGEMWSIMLSCYHGNEFVKTVEITDTMLDNKMYFTSYTECMKKITGDTHEKIL